MRSALPLLLALAVVLGACSSKPTDPGDSDSGISDGGCTTCTPPWKVYTLDDTQTPNQVSTLPQIAMAISSDDTVGVAYFVQTDQTDDLGKTLYALRYVSFAGGQASAPETLRDMENVYGVSIAYQADGEPAVAYLGGDPTAPPSSGGATYWFQGDAVVSYRNQGTWTEQPAATSGDQAVAGNPVSDSQDGVVGLTPALGFDGTTAYLAYRDIHFGQFPTDYDGSDWELAYGGPTSWSHQVIVPGGNDKLAWGAQSQMVIVDGQPAIVSDKQVKDPIEQAVDIRFRWRQADGGWVVPSPTPVMQINNLQSGPSLAYDITTGFGIAAVDSTAGALYYTQSSDGVTWTIPDPLVQEGSGGWYPSLAFDPTTHDPSIAYYFCSSTSGIAEGECPSDQDELRIADFNSAANRWNISTVDTEGAFQPKLGFLSNGKRVIAFRDVTTGEVKLEVEQ